MDWYGAAVALGSGLAGNMLACVINTTLTRPSWRAGPNAFVMIRSAPAERFATSARWAAVGRWLEPRGISPLSGPTAWKTAKDTSAWTAETFSGNPVSAWEVTGTLRPIVCPVLGMNVDRSAA